MAKWCIPLSYKPKIEAVFSGQCCQTIRKGTKYRVGDTITLFEWAGRPYRSTWRRRLCSRIVSVSLLGFTDEQVVCNGRCISWGAGEIGRIALADGIDPPTGHALRDALKRLNGKDWQGWYQVIRWGGI